MTLYWRGSQNNAHYFGYIKPLDDDDDDDVDEIFKLYLKQVHRQSKAHNTFTEFWRVQ